MKKPKPIGDAPKAPPIDKPVAGIVDNLIAHYRESIADYRSKKPNRKLVADRSTWILAGDFASKPPSEQKSKISEFELALDYAEHSLQTLQTLLCHEIEPHELGQLFDAVDRLAIEMHKLGKISCEIGMVEHKQKVSQGANWNGRELVKQYVLDEAQHRSINHENCWQLSKELVDLTTAKAHDFGDKRFLNIEDKQKSINSWLKDVKPPLKFRK